MSENEKTGLNNSTYNILSALGRDADFLYDTIDKYIRDAESANKSDLVELWKTIKNDRHKHIDMLKEALKAYDTLGIKEVIITCDKSNIPSANVIKNCKGELEEEFYSETFKEMIQRYIIRR